MKDVLITGNQLESGHIYHFHKVGLIGHTDMIDKGYGAVEVRIDGMPQAVKLTDLEVIEYDET